MPCQYNITFSSSLTSSNPDTDGVLVVGKYADLIKLKDNTESIKCKFGESVTDKIFNKGLEQLSADTSDTVELWFKNFTLATLPAKYSHHNAPMTPHALSNIVKCASGRSLKESIVVVCSREYAFALGCAIGRVFPLYQQKTTTDKKAELSIQFLFSDFDNKLTSEELKCLQSAVDSIRLAGKIVDMPCNLMHTDAFLEEIRSVGKELGIIPVIIQGEELNEKGFGGIYGVGKAAIHQPALAVLSYKSSCATHNIAWCGKGIVYDTGGLSIKDKNGMPGMKRDCGGAAALLGAFKATVEMGFTENLHLVLCLAENAVGPIATRPDDVHTLYSGLTVEVNNTDAEGRLVLGDGVAYAKNDLNANIIVDMATLTGAQGIATGQYHAAILTNNESWERACVSAGKISGDLCHSVPYTPEFHFEEFTSTVADMKNSVKSRSNAQVSCAGLFIGSHIGFDFKGVWLHVDMAGPVCKNERATGYGVALMMALFGRYSMNPVLQKIAPSFE